MYTLDNAMVRWKGIKSESFSMKNGLKQGAILSPYLFSVFLDPLLKEINGSRLGCYIGNIPCNVLAFSDDVVLLSPSVTALKKMVGNCEKYSNNYFVKFNSEKSQILNFNKSEANFNIQINNQKIESFNEVKHLGFCLSNSKSFYNVKSTMNDFKARTNSIVTNFKYLDTNSRIALFNSQCMGLYGCSLWDLSTADIGRFEVTYRKCCRVILKISPRTHNILIPQLMTSKNFKCILEQRFLNFICDGIAHENLLISCVFRNSFMNNGTYLMKCINTILKKYNIEYIKIFGGKKIVLNDKCFAEEWKINLIKELLYLKDFRIFDVLSLQEINVILNQICTD